jgi:hypothetical protein
MRSSRKPDRRRSLGAVSGPPFPLPVCTRIVLKVQMATQISDGYGERLEVLPSTARELQEQDTGLPRTQPAGRVSSSFPASTGTLPRRSRQAAEAPVRTPAFERLSPPFLS